MVIEAVCSSRNTVGEASNRAAVGVNYEKQWITVM